MDKNLKKKEKGKKELDEEKRKVPDAKWFPCTWRFGENTLGNFLRSHCPDGGSVAFPFLPGWTKLPRFRNGGGNAAEHFHVVGDARRATGNRQTAPVQQSQGNERAVQLCFECTLLRFKRWDTPRARGSAQTAIKCVRCNRSETPCHGRLNVFLDEYPWWREKIGQIFDRPPTVGLVSPITSVDQSHRYESRDRTVNRSVKIARCEPWSTTNTRIFKSQTLTRSFRLSLFPSC